MSGIDDSANEDPKHPGLWVVMTCSDLTEGRGSDYPVQLCALESTARRLAKGRYVQGGNCPIFPVAPVYVCGTGWMIPLSQAPLTGPTDADVEAERVLTQRREAYTRARAAGLSEDDIRALGRGGL